MKYLWLTVASVCIGVSYPSLGEELGFPRVIKTRYEAVDTRLGGQFMMWSEREKVHYGLDPKLYPGAKEIEITQVTPAQGSIALTFVEIKTVIGAVPDYLYLTGGIRFRVSGMTLKSSNFQIGGGGMAPSSPTN